MLSAAEALERLKQGNQFFMPGGPSEPAPQRYIADGTVPKQEPFAIFLGCSDARVPLEMVFNQGVGDLFVIRVAGNIVQPSQIGSIEFAAEQFGTRLVVVMGHSNCGAVAATLQELQQPSGLRSPNLASIVNLISPAVEPLATNPDGLDPAALQQEAMRANVRSSVANLHQGSEVLQNLVQHDGLQIVGAEYSIETGGVTFLDEAAQG